jgi:putative membrane protein
MGSKQNWSAAIMTAALAVGATAQTRDPRPPAQNQSIVTAEAPGATAAAAKDAGDVEFLVEALRTSLAEIEMGRLASQRGHDPRVRDYGAKLESDHTAHATEIERLLQPIGVTIPVEPSAEAQTHLAALARLSGAAFDTAFVDMMIASHTEAIEQYGAQTHANPDRALHDFAAKGLPILRDHLQIAESLR